MTPTERDPLWEPGFTGLVEKYLYELSGDQPAAAEAFARRNPAHDGLLARIRALHGRMEAALSQLASASSHGDSTAEGRAQEVPRPLPQPQIPGFDLLREIGRGGMGVVYEAKDPATGRHVALKVIHVRDGHATAERYQREVSALARLRSPHVVTLYSSTASDGVFCYAMELLEGETFERLIARWRKEPTPERFLRATEVVAQAAAGAEVIHAAGIIHRDLKPSNIFVTADGTVKLIDFGLVRVLGVDTVTRTGAIIGSSPYMSPEQILRDAGPVDPRSDVYALGISLYEACVLKLPFEGGEGKLLARVVEDAWTPPSLVEPAIPCDLAAIIERATEFRAEDRYQSAGALAADLRAFLAGAPVSARPVSRWGRVWRRVRRRRKALTLVSALVVLAIVGAMIFAGLRESSRVEEAIGRAIDSASRAAAEYRTVAAMLPSARSRASQVTSLVSEKDTFAERRPLLAAQEEADRLADRASASFEAALLAAQRGLEERPDHGGLRSIVSSLAWERLLEVEGLGRPVELQRLRALLLSYAPELQPRLRPRARLSVSSNPPGAAVYLFRYEASGPFLLPLPYRPDTGLLLRVEEFPPAQMKVVREPHAAVASLGIRRGDRIVSVAGALVDSAGNRILRRLGEVEAPTIEIDREGDRISLLLPHIVELQEVWRVLNDCVESDAFPLAFLPGAELGTTPIPEIEVDGGSYLVVLQLGGYRAARLPAFLRRDERREIRLNIYTEAEIGPDMVCVPAGPALLGGDPMAFSPEPERTVTLPDFFISRREVTVEEYFRFLNDPAVRAEIAAAPGGETGSPLLPVNSEARGAPRFYESLRQGDVAGYRPIGAESVQRYLPRTAAERYVAWLNDQESKKRGGRRFALPTPDEIEKAGRGADGRRFPWGNGFDLSLVSSYRSAGSADLRRLAFATDASPYDVRDIAGSVCEWTRNDEVIAFASPSSAKYIEARVKGGSFYDDLEPYFRIGGHTRERVREGSYRIGFRVVAYPPAAAWHEDGQKRHEAGLAFSDDPYAVPRWVADVDGDGRADYCRLKGASPPEGDGLSIGCLLFESEGFGAEIELRGVDLGEPGNRWFADIDGDRRADFCRLMKVATPAEGRRELRCLLSRGSGFEGEVSSVVIEAGLADNRWFADVDGDQRADFCRLVEITAEPGRRHEVRCLLSRASRFEGDLASGPIEPGLEGNRWFADVNGDGRADFCRLVPIVEPNSAGLGLRCLLSTGDRFSGEIMTGAIQVGLEGSRWLADVNGDHCADFCRFISEEDTSEVRCLLASKEGFGQDRALRLRMTVGRKWNRWWVDVNGDGLFDFVNVEAVRWSSQRFYLHFNCLSLDERLRGELRSHVVSE